MLTGQDLLMLLIRIMYGRSMRMVLKMDISMLYMNQEF